MKTSRLFPRRYRLRYWVMVFGSMVSLIRRQARQYALIDWARRKRLKGPRIAYQRKLSNVEAQLVRYRMRQPAAFALAQLTYHFSEALAGLVRPRYHARA